MRSRKKVKLRTLPSEVDKSKVLEKKVMKSVRLANERIKSINRKYKDSKYTWSINKLKNLIPEYIKNERIQIPKKIKEIELINIYKSVESFLKSKQSTKKGIKEVQNKTKETFSKNFKEFNEDEVTDEDVDTFYDLFVDPDYLTLCSSLGVDPSDFIYVFEDAKEMHDTFDEFLARIQYYGAYISDESVRNKAIKLYDKYIK